jgi:AbiU2
MTDIFEQTMGPELGKIFTALGNELSELSAICDDCIFLFGDGSEDHVALMNTVAHAFFARTQRTFERELMLGVCRITDPVMTKVGGKAKDNLTILRFVDLLTRLRPKIVPELKSRILVAQDAAEFAKDWRNRWLAHRSLDLSTTAQTAKPLDSSTYSEIDNALTALDEVLKTVAKAFDNGGDGFRSLPGSRSGGSRSLVRALATITSLNEPQAELFLSSSDAEIAAGISDVG